jgi:hypothetical protein
MPFCENTFEARVRTLTNCPVRYVPAWMPGAGFKKLSAATRAVAEKVRFGPYDAVSAAMV